MSSKLNETLRGKRIYVHPDDASIMLKLHASFYGVPVIEKSNLESGKAYFVDLDKLLEPPDCPILAGAAR